MEVTNGVNAVSKAVLELYDTAYAEALADPEFSRFREWSPDISEVTEEHFLHEYVYVVLNAGMKQQVARQVYEKWYYSEDPDVIGHHGKREAVRRAMGKYKDWFFELCNAEDKVGYLETLPYIGPITKYHLAKNIGLDVVKPVRHLTRLAEQFGFESPYKMCDFIAAERNTKKSHVDSVLWIYANRHGTLETVMS